MKKTIFSIIILICLIGVVGYYGYTAVISQTGLSEQDAEAELSMIDEDTQDITNQGLNEETLSGISGQESEMTKVSPATIAEIDTLTADINSFSSSDTSGYNTSLSDL